MAWRIDEAVIRGELDNRLRGRVSGHLWLVGRPEPVQLALRGDGWRDLAGHRLQFTNPNARPVDLEGFVSLQDGVVGDMTASRRVRVPDVPMDQLEKYYRARKPFPWHWGNAIYLEWFNRRNGRVVIESASFKLKIVGEAAWEMSAEEERAQHEANGVAITDFIKRLAAGSRRIGDEPAGPAGGSR